MDTFEAEDDLDIEAIAYEIKTIDESMQVTDQTIAEYCAELNISTPF